jgi:hypothetical protein
VYLGHVADPEERTMTTDPSRRRVPARLVAVVGLALALVVLHPAAAEAKGPLPGPPEPAGALVAGQDTTITLRVPEASDGFEVDHWGERPPWHLVAMAGGSAGGELRDAVDLPLRFQGGGVYTATLRPPSAGPWRLALAWPDERTGGWFPAEAERTVTVAEPPSPVPVPETGRRAPLIGIVVVVGLAGVAAAAVASRRRGSPAPSPSGAA